MIVVNNRKYQHLYICIICGLVAVSVVRAETHDTKQPVHIQADKMLVSPKNQFIVFQGNVKVTQENIQLSADTLDLYLISSVNTANITKESVQKINAKGHVRIHWKEYQIEADSAIYIPLKNQLVISGNMARLYQGKNNIAGATIILDLKTDQIEISSKKGEQVEANYEFSDQDYKKLKSQR